VETKEIAVVKHISVLVVGLALVLGSASAVQAQDATYVTPFIGIVNDDGSNPVIGASAMFVLDPPVNFEVDFGYAWDSEEFDDAETSANLTTIMANAVFPFQTGTAVEPYAAGGIGLMRSSVDLDEIGLGSDSSTAFGFNLGGGAYFFFSEKLGVRGDVRYFRAVADDDSLLNEVDFVRVTGGVTFKF
jgi:opacity protein-like surface antigen